MVTFKSIGNRLFPGISWQHPVFRVVIRALDPIDYVVRATRGLTHLPRYSFRVRSNGVTNQLGGKAFHQYGQVLAGLLREHLSLAQDSEVLEIGCGCGRTALALTPHLGNGRYVGMDIERTSLNACMTHPWLIEKTWRFDLIDVRNDEYNPGGRNDPADYVFPYRDAQFEIIFLVSVFTHMLTADVTNYIAEISRMLKPGGRLMVTTFLVNYGVEEGGLDFRYHSAEHYYCNPSLPEKAVGYQLSFYQKTFSENGMSLLEPPLLGGWRHSSDVPSGSGFPQDVLFAVKN